MHEPKTYSEFWIFYLKAHRKPKTRLLHYIGTLLGTGFLFLAITQGVWLWLLPGVIFSYGLAWAGHFIIEKNKPATFLHPLWSFISDYRMLALAITGKLKAHLDSIA